MTLQTYILDWRINSVELLDHSKMFRVVGLDFAGTEVVFSCVSESAAQTLLRLIDVSITHALIERQRGEAV